MMMVPNMSITASQPKPSPRGLADADVQFRHMEEPITDDAILSAKFLATKGNQAFQGSPGHLPWQRWAEGDSTSTMDVIPTSDLPAWLRASVARLLRLCALEFNWDSYGSPPPSLALVKNVISWLRFAEKETLPEPEVVPASAGGIQLEWYLGKRELEIEFTATGQIEYLRSDKERREEKEDVIKDLDDLRSLLGWLIG